MMETKVPNFVSTMSRTIKCNPCSKLFINQQGLFHTVKLKTRVKNIKLYCIYRCFNTQNYIYPFQNLSLGFILEIFLKFRKFQPRYSYKIYSYKKKSVLSTAYKEKTRIKIKTAYIIWLLLLSSYSSKSDETYLCKVSVRSGFKAMYLSVPFL